MTATLDPIEIVAPEMLTIPEMRNTILLGDVREQLRRLPDESVQCVVTSPPYWGLRDYGTAEWEGGDEGCRHVGDFRPRAERPKGIGGIARGGSFNDAQDEGKHAFREICGKCGARRIDSQLGLEATPEEFTSNMAAVFEEVRRVLRTDGTLWLNMGDSYAGSWGNYSGENRGSASLPMAAWDGRERERPAASRRHEYLKPKDLIGQPWRLAFELQSRGWYLRSEIIWSKPNPMPESVTDRPTKSHEQLFLLTKSAHYFYDADAIREGIAEAGVIERPNRDGQPLVFRQNLRPQDPSPAGTAVGICLAASILELAKRQDDLGLLPLNAEVGQQSSDGDTGLAVIGIPIMRRAATEAARFADGDVSAKQFLEEINRLCVALPDGDDLKEARRNAISDATSIFNADRDRAVTVDDTSQVSQFQLIHSKRHHTRNEPSPHMVDTPRRDGDRWRLVDAGVATRGRRNKRTVWTIATQPYSEAHFATFPQELVKPCIQAGTSERGACAECGAPWRRVTETVDHAGRLGKSFNDHEDDLLRGHRGVPDAEGAPVRRTVGWQPTCKCYDRFWRDLPRTKNARRRHQQDAADTWWTRARGRPLPPEAEIVPCIVLDPFMGSGTTALVALTAARSYVGVELNPNYVAMANKRLKGLKQQGRLL